MKKEAIYTRKEVIKMKSSIRMEYKEEEMRKAAIYAEKR
jgi:hypothetical protein